MLDDGGLGDAAMVVVVVTYAHPMQPGERVQVRIRVRSALVDWRLKGVSGA